MLPTSSEPLEMIPILTFGLGGQHYALHIESVIEVAAMVELVTISNMPSEFLGVANRHGEVLPVLDLRPVMNCPALPIDEWTLFIVGQHEGRMIGLVVDDVQQVEYVPAVQIHKSSASGTNIRGIISYKQRLIQLVALAPLIAVYSTSTTTDDMLKVEL